MSDKFALAMFILFLSGMAMIDDHPVASIFLVFIALGVAA